LTPSGAGQLAIVELTYFISTYLLFHLNFEVFITYFSVIEKLRNILAVN